MAPKMAVALATAGLVVLAHAPVSHGLECRFWAGKAGPDGTAAAKSTDWSDNEYVNTTCGSGAYRPRFAVRCANRILQLCVCVCVAAVLGRTAGPAPLF